MPEKQIQEHLFHRIKSLLPPDQSLADTVADILCVSQDSAYRRIRGQTPLVLEEAKTLCSLFHISLDQLLALHDNSVVFQNLQTDNGESGFKTFLQGIRKNLEQLCAAAERSILYITNDIPFFYQFCYKPVIALRYFFWMKGICQHPDFQHRKFSLNCLPADIEELGREILSLYSKIPSAEIWNTDCVNSTLLQLNHYCETGLMTREQAREVCAALRLSVEHVERQAEHGRKFLPGESPHSKKDNFQLFYNRVGLGGNNVLTLCNGQKTLYLNYDALNYMATTDEAFCNKMHRQWQSIVRRSTLISSASEKQRNGFFNILYAKLPQHEAHKAKQAS